MWTEAQLIEDLRNLGLSEGADVLVHASLRAIGPIDGGAETLAKAFQQVLGPTGTLMVPAFTPNLGDPAEWRSPPETPEELERLRSAAPVFDAETTPIDTPSIGIFAEIVRRLPDSQRSHHPVVSFAATGANAVFLTQNAPFHYPLGTESPLARLHQLNGWILLIGVGQEVNSSLHLAEIWADVPYIHRSATVKTGPDRWSAMQGSPECSEGFGKIESLLRQARLMRRGYIGNAPSQLMRQREVVSMAVALLKGAGDTLLCNDLNCPWCRVARKYTAETTHIEGQSV
jgi:aminoglycoside 3-N-acetyltransferase